MTRGDLIVVAVPGDYGKPRPALIVQSDLFNETHASITMAPISSTIVDTPLFRVTIEPSRRNGLRVVSQIMVDKVTTIPASKLGYRIGRLDDENVTRLDRALMIHLGLAG